MVPSQPSSNKFSGSHQPGPEFETSIPCQERTQAVVKGTKHKPNLANTVRIQATGTSWAAPAYDSPNLLTERLIEDPVTWCGLGYYFCPDRLNTGSQNGNDPLVAGLWGARGNTGRGYPETRINVLRHAMYLNLIEYEWLTQCISSLLRYTIWTEDEFASSSLSLRPQQTQGVNNRTHCTPWCCLSELRISLAWLLWATVPTMTAASIWISKRGVPLY